MLLDIFCLTPENYSEWVIIKHHTCLSIDQTWKIWLLVRFPSEAGWGELSPPPSPSTFGQKLFFLMISIPLTSEMMLTKRIRAYIITGMRFNIVNVKSASLHNPSGLEYSRPHHIWIHDFVLQYSRPHVFEYLSILEVNQCWVNHG